MKRTVGRKKLQNLFETVPCQFPELDSCKGIGIGLSICKTHHHRPSWNADMVNADGALPKAGASATEK